jgi:hypothetical protein
VTKRAPSEQELKDCLFAWTVARHVKSNAIVYAKDGITAGIGAGQMNRRDSSRIAAMKAKPKRPRNSAGPPRARYGSAVASDAFFPFADGLLAAAEAGHTAVIQPGGSMRDAEVIDAGAADEAGLAMVFTGMRHFRHCFAKNPGQICISSRDQRLMAGVRQEQVIEYYFVRAAIIERGRWASGNLPWQIQLASVQYLGLPFTSDAIKMKAFSRLHHCR